MLLFLIPVLLGMSSLLTWELGVPGGVNVALPTNITAEDVAKVINEAELVGMACSVDELATLAPVLGACATLRTFIVMDHEGCTNPQLPALVKQASPYEGASTCHGAFAAPTLLLLNVSMCLH